MKCLFTFFTFIFFTLFLNGQSINRVEVEGVMLSSTNDVEAVTVFNTSSNKGTITNEEGEFVIKVAENDVIEVSALQFQTVTITIDADVIKYKELKIQLIEQVNQLDAVTLTSGLTGNIETDITNVKTVKPIVLDMGNMDVDFEYNDDKAFDDGILEKELKSLLNPDERNYLPNFGKIFKLFTKSKANLSLKKDLFVDKQEEKQKDLLEIYNHNYIIETYSISDEDVESFIAFVENKGIKPEFFNPENEVQLIELLFKESKLFLKLQDVKN